MAPRRKRSRLNSLEPSSQPPNLIQPPTTTTGTSQTSNNAPGASSQPATSQGQKQGNATKQAERPATHNSWYTGGSWRSKTNPVAEVAKESIFVSGGATSESLSESSGQNSGQYMHNSLKRSRKSVPLVAEATRINVTGKSTAAGKSTESIPEGQSQAEKPVVPEEAIEDDKEPAPSRDHSTASVTDSESVNAKPVSNATSWFGWWSKPDEDAVEKEKANGNAQANAQGQPTGTDGGDPMDVDSPGGHENARSGASAEGMDVDKPQEPAPRSWFNLWSMTQNEKAQAQAPVADKAPSTTTVESVPPSKADQPGPQDANASTPSRPATREYDAPPKSSGWAFWSMSSETAADTPSGTQKQIGELAVADTPSQSHPEAAQFNEERPPSQRPKKSAKEATTAKLVAAAAAVTPKKQSETVSAVQTPVSAAKWSAIKQSEVKTPSTPKTEMSKPNLVLPAFSETYPPSYVPTYWERIGQYLATSLNLANPYLPPHTHVSVTTSPVKVKKAIAIGVHGYFPAALIQKVIGQPTGTSIKFANWAAASIRSWTEQHQPDVACEIEQVALEGEGFIADRVTTLWKLLLNWLSHLRSADLIFVACHSQGVPVALMLVAKLIQLGCLSSNTRIGVCAMAGVNLGPFSDYKSRYIGGSAAELFDFSRTDSRVSKDYASALETCLRNSVRVTYVGSLDDQLVSLESAIFSTLSHPYVQRAVFVDGRLHSSDFITRLVAFALKLRNLGISDHGLIRELSLPLAGSIYGGEGHSRVYDDAAVYEQALRFTLETNDIDSSSIVDQLKSLRPQSPARRRTSQSGIPNSTSVANSIRRASSNHAPLPGIPPTFASYEVPQSGAAANPYFLPWAMRGILEEDAVKRDMQTEVTELIKLFALWRPTSKPLKDVRFRLEAVGSKL